MKASDNNILFWFRWLALVPVSAFLSILTTLGLVFLTKDLIKDSSLWGKSEHFAFAIYVSVAAIVWLVVGYSIAPKFKNKVLWVFYALGSILSFLLYQEIYSHNHQGMFYYIPWFICIGVGLITSVLLHFGKDLLDEIEH